MNHRRYILLADMNAFFASCHQSAFPTLRNKPIIVSGSLTNRNKGIVIAASYEAKRRGVYTTMSNFEAKKACPEAIFVQRDHSLYQNYSEKIMEFLKLIGRTEVASIDEAYVDITDRVEAGTSPRRIAQFIQQTLWSKIHIPCSIGIGPNRIIAKMASNIKKPRGYVHMGIKQFCSYFHPRSLDLLHGCGTKTVEKLNQHGLKTIGALASAEPLLVRSILGKRGEQLQLAAQGISSDLIDPEREKGDKSIGRETTFAEETTNPDLILELAEKMVFELSARLKEKGKKARTVSIVYKLERVGASHSKSHTLPTYVDETNHILPIVEKLYRDHLWEVPVRLFGVRLANIEEPSFIQLSFQDLEL